MLLNYLQLTLMFLTCWLLIDNLNTSCSFLTLWNVTYNRQWHGWLHCLLLNIWRSLHWQALIVAILFKDFLKLNCTIRYHSLCRLIASSLIKTLLQINLIFFALFLAILLNALIMEDWIVVWRTWQRFRRRSVLSKTAQIKVHNLMFTISSTEEKRNQRPLIII